MQTTLARGCRLQMNVAERCIRATGGRGDELGETEKTGAHALVI